MSDDEDWDADFSDASNSSQQNMTSSLQRKLTIGNLSKKKSKFDLMEGVANTTNTTTNTTAPPTATTTTSATNSNNNNNTSTTFNKLNLSNSNNNNNKQTTPVKPTSTPNKPSAAPTVSIQNYTEEEEDDDDWDNHLESPSKSILQNRKESVADEWDADFGDSPTLSGIGIGSPSQMKILGIKADPTTKAEWDDDFVFNDSSESENKSILTPTVNILSRARSGNPNITNSENKISHTITELLSLINFGADIETSFPTPSNSISISNIPKLSENEFKKKVEIQLTNIEIKEIKGDKFEISKGYYELGLLYQVQQQNIFAFNQFSSANKIYQDYKEDLEFDGDSATVVPNNDSYEIDLYFNLGISSKSMANIFNATEYLKKALEVSQKDKIKFQSIQLKILLELGLAYQTSETPIVATKYFEQLLRLVLFSHCPSTSHHHNKECLSMDNQKKIKEWNYTSIGCYQMAKTLKQLNEIDLSFGYIRRSIYSIKLVTPATATTRLQENESIILMNEIKKIQLLNQQDADNTTVLDFDSDDENDIAREKDVPDDKSISASGHAKRAQEEDEDDEEDWDAELGLDEEEDKRPVLQLAGQSPAVATSVGKDRMAPHYKLLDSVMNQNFEIVKYPKPSYLYSLATVDGHPFLHEEALSQWLSSIIVKHLQGEDRALRVVSQRSSIEELRNDFAHESHKLKKQPKIWARSTLEFCYTLHIFGHDQLCWDTIMEFFTDLRDCISTSSIRGGVAPVGGANKLPPSMTPTAKQLQQEQEEKDVTYHYAFQMLYLASKLWTIEEDPSFKHMYQGLKNLSQNNAPHVDIIVAECYSHHLHHRNLNNNDQDDDSDYDTSSSDGSNEYADNEGSESGGDKSPNNNKRRNKNKNNNNNNNRHNEDSDEEPEFRVRPNEFSSMEEEKINPLNTFLRVYQQCNIKLSIQQQQKSTATNTSSPSPSPSPSKINVSSSLSSSSLHHQPITPSNSTQQIYRSINPNKEYLEIGTKNAMARALIDIHFHLNGISPLTTKRLVNDDYMNQMGGMDYTVNIPMGGGSEIELLLDANYRMKLLTDLYPEIPPTFLKAKAAYALGLNAVDSNDLILAEKFLFECLYIIDKCKQPAIGLPLVLSELSANASVAYAGVLLDNFKYQYAIVSFDNALLNYNIRKKKEYGSLLRKVAALARENDDIPSAIYYYKQILNNYLEDDPQSKTNEIIYLCETISTLYWEKGSYKQAEEYLKVIYFILSRPAQSPNNNGGSGSGGSGSIGGIGSNGGGANGLMDLPPNVSRTPDTPRYDNPIFFQFQLKMAALYLESYHFEKGLELLEFMKRHPLPHGKLNSLIFMLAKAYTKKEWFEEATLLLSQLDNEDTNSSGSGFSMFGGSGGVGSSGGGNSNPSSLNSSSSSSSSFQNHHHPHHGQNGINNSGGVTSGSSGSGSSGGLMGIGRVLKNSGTVIGVGRNSQQHSGGQKIERNLKYWELQCLNYYHSNRFSEALVCIECAIETCPSSSLNTRGQYFYIRGKVFQKLVSFSNATLVLFPTTLRPTGDDWKEIVDACTTTTYNCTGDLIQECVASYKRAYHYFKSIGDDVKIQKTVSRIAETYLDRVFGPVALLHYPFDDVARLPHFPSSKLIQKDSEQEQQISDLKKRKLKKDSLRSSDQPGSNSSNTSSTPVTVNQPKSTTPLKEFYISFELIENPAMLALDINIDTCNILVLLKNYMNMAELKFLQGDRDLSISYWVECKQLYYTLFFDGPSLIIKGAPLQFIKKIFNLCKRMLRFLFAFDQELINKNLMLIDSYLNLEIDIQQATQRPIQSSKPMAYESTPQIDKIFVPYAYKSLTIGRSFKKNRMEVSFSVNSRNVAPPPINHHSSNKGGVTSPSSTGSKNSSSTTNTTGGINSNIVGGVSNLTFGEKTKDEEKSVLNGDEVGEKIWGSFHSIRNEIRKYSIGKISQEELSTRNKGIIKQILKVMQSFKNHVANSGGLSNTSPTSSSSSSSNSSTSSSSSTATSPSSYGYNSSSSPSSSPMQTSIPGFSTNNLASLFRSQAKGQLDGNNSSGTGNNSVRNRTPSNATGGNTGSTSTGTIGIASGLGTVRNQSSKYEEISFNSTTSRINASLQRLVISLQVDNYFIHYVPSSGRKKFNRIGGVEELTPLAPPSNVLYLEVYLLSNANEKASFVVSPLITLEKILLFLCNRPYWATTAPSDMPSLTPSNNTSSNNSGSNSNNSSIGSNSSISSSTATSSTTTGSSDTGTKKKSFFGSFSKANQNSFKSTPKFLEKTNNFHNEFISFLTTTIGPPTGNSTIEDDIHSTPPLHPVVSSGGGAPDSPPQSSRRGGSNILFTNDNSSDKSDSEKSDLSREFNRSDSNSNNNINTSTTTTTTTTTTTHQISHGHQSTHPYIPHPSILLNPDIHGRSMSVGSSSGRKVYTTQQISLVSMAKRMIRSEDPAYSKAYISIDQLSYQICKVFSHREMRECSEQNPLSLYLFVNSGEERKSLSSFDQNGNQKTNDQAITFTPEILHSFQSLLSLSSTDKNPVEEAERKKVVSEIQHTTFSSLFEILPAEKEKLKQSVAAAAAAASNASTGKKVSVGSAMKSSLPFGLFSSSSTKLSHHNTDNIPLVNVSASPLLFICSKSLQIFPWELILPEFIVRYKSLFDILKSNYYSLTSSSSGEDSSHGSGNGVVNNNNENNNHCPATPLFISCCYSQLEKAQHTDYLKKEYSLKSILYSLYTTPLKPVGNRVVHSNHPYHSSLIKVGTKPSIVKKKYKYLEFFDLSTSKNHHITNLIDQVNQSNNFYPILVFTYNDLVDLSQIPIILLKIKPISYCLFIPFSKQKEILNRFFKIYDHHLKQASSSSSGGKSGSSSNLNSSPQTTRKERYQFLISTIQSVKEEFYTPIVLYNPTFFVNNDEN